jgi:hypothetical protein
VFANEIAFVKDVARRLRELGRQIDMAAVALTRLPLVLVCVTAEALRHWRTQRRLVRLPRSGMARNALTTELRDVFVVREAEVLSREAILFTGVSLTVAPVAGTRIVGARVASLAGRVLGEVKRPDVRRTSDALMARQAVDPRTRVCAMFERMLRVLRLDPQKPCARCEREQERKQGDAHQRAHRAVFS